ncbi:Carbohydrate-binding module family 67 protein [Pleurotus pulmonarius]
MFAQGILFLFLALGLVQAQRPGCTAPTPSPPKGNGTCGTGENAVPAGPNPAGPRAFRKTVTSQCGKCAVGAKILITADNSYKLFVNGNPIGTGSNFTNAEVYYVALQPASNLFAVEATNSEGPAGLMASILVQYSDGSTETVITDETWRRFLGSPKGFELPSTTDLSKWGFATFQGLYGVAPWGKTVLPPALSVKDAQFIWTGKFDNKTGVAPTLARAFRKTVVTPGCTKRAVSATAVVYVDNTFTFYVNGAKVGSFASWREARVYYIPVLDPDVNVFAINGKNTGGPAAFLAVIQISYDDGTSETVVTDSTWKADEKVTAGFESPKLDDSKWANATSMGYYGRPPFKFTVPSV